MSPSIKKLFIDSFIIFSALYTFLFFNHVIFENKILLGSFKEFIYIPAGLVVMFVFIYGKKSFIGIFLALLLSFCVFDDKSILDSLKVSLTTASLAFVSYYLAIALLSSKKISLYLVFLTTAMFTFFVSLSELLLNYDIFLFYLNIDDVLFGETFFSFFGGALIFFAVLKILAECYKNIALFYLRQL